jgi:tRNA(Arg) A34 adenosine deaminase TadA
MPVLQYSREESAYAIPYGGGEVKVFAAKPIRLSEAYINNRRSQLRYATNLAILGALDLRTIGIPDYLTHIRERIQDLPVAALAIRGSDHMLGQYIASDNRLVRTNDPVTKRKYSAQAVANRRQGYHGERLALQQANARRKQEPGSIATAMVVTLEPCDSCQDFFAAPPQSIHINEMVYGTSRDRAAEIGVLKPHPQSFFERAQDNDFGLNVIRIDDPATQAVNEELLRCVDRDRWGAEGVQLDAERVTHLAREVGLLREGRQLIAA